MQKNHSDQSQKKQIESKAFKNTICGIEAALLEKIENRTTT
jgi:hypothetical protein